MEGFAAPYLLVLLGLLVLFPGLPALAVVLLFLPRYRTLARYLALIGVISFILVIFANVLNWILLMYVYPQVLVAFRAGAELWSFLEGPWFVLGELWFVLAFGLGPCLWSCFAVYIGVLLGSLLGHRLGKTAS